MNQDLEIRGVATVSNNILNGVGRLKWCVRDNPIGEDDTGWTFLSEIDDDEFCADSGNFSIIPYIKVFKIEPAVLWIFEMPIGTDIQLIIKKGKRDFVDNNTGKIIKL
jgi:hypothetical protein